MKPHRVLGDDGDAQRWKMFDAVPSSVAPKLPFVDGGSPVASPLKEVAPLAQQAHKASNAQTHEDRVVGINSSEKKK